MKIIMILGILLFSLVGATQQTYHSRWEVHTDATLLTQKKTFNHRTTLEFKRGQSILLIKNDIEKIRIKNITRQGFQSDSSGISTFYIGEMDGNQVDILLSEDKLTVLLDGIFHTFIIYTWKK